MEEISSKILIKWENFTQCFEKMFNEILKTFSKKFKELQKTKSIEKNFKKKT